MNVNLLSVFNIIQWLSIWTKEYQYASMRICESPDVLSTGIDLTDIRCTTLKTKQSSISKGFRFNTELQQLIYNTITSSNYQSAMMATLSYNALICSPDDIFCSAAKVMDPNFRKEVSQQSNSWFEYWISHTYNGTILQWTVTIWGS